VNNNLQRRLADLFESIGTAVIAVIALMDDRVRPIIEEIIAWLRSFGLRSARLARQLFERHLIATVLRPLMVVSSIVTCAAMGFGLWLASRLTGWDLGPETRTWFGGAFIALCLFAFIVSLRSLRHAAMTDADIRRLRAGNPLLTQMRQVYDQALALHNQIVQNMQLAHQQAILAHQQAMLAAVQANRRRRPTAPTPPTLPEAPELPELRLTTQQTEQVRTWLEQEVLDQFGPPGRPFRLAIGILMAWIMAGIWFIAMGGILGSFHRASIWNAGFDQRWPMAFVATGSVFILIAAVLWIGGAVVSGATVRYGLGAILWSVRVGLKPSINALPFWDDQNLDEIIKPDLGVPLEAWHNGIITAHRYPLAVVFLFLILVTTMPGVYYYGFISLLALVLLGGWYTLHTFGIKEEIAVKRIIIGLFVLAVYQLIRQGQRTDVMVDVQYLTNLWYGFIGAETIVIVFIGGAALALGWAIKKLAPHERIGKIAVYAGGGIALTAFLVLGSLLISFYQRPDSRYQAPTPTVTAPPAPPPSGDMVTPRRRLGAAMAI
jgi:hypothetical protein